MNDTSTVETGHQAILDSLVDTVPDLKGVVLARTDGFEVCSSSRLDIPVSRLAALASSMISLGQAALRELGLETAHGGSVLVEGSLGKLLLVQVDVGEDELVLALLGDKDAVTGKLLWAAKDAAKQLSII